MSSKLAKNPKNVAGAWYCTDPEDPKNDGEGCIACGLCYGAAPEFFKEDENGNAYVWKQPSTEAEIALCQEQLDDCPVNSIGKDA